MILPIPYEARQELTGLRQICEAGGLSYADAVWALRCPGDVPKPSSAWPYVPASARLSNVTPLRKGRK